MKKVLIIALAIFLALSVVGCVPASEVKKYEPDSYPDYEKVIENFVPSRLNTFTLKVGDEHKPGASIWLQGGDNTGSAYSSNTEVVTVSEYGIVTAVGEGSAYVVIASSSTVYDVYRYDVVDSNTTGDENTTGEIDYAAMIDSFVPSSLNTFELTVGDEHTPSAAVWLKNGSGSGTAYSSDEKVVNVSEYGIVTAVGEGTAFVVITGAGNMFQVFKYEVYAEAPNADLSDLPVIDGINLSKEIENFKSTDLNTFTLKIGEMHTPGASIWASSGGSCFTTDGAVVTISENGNVTATGKGTAYVVIKEGIGTMFEIYKYVVNG